MSLDARVELGPEAFARYSNRRPPSVAGDFVTNSAGLRFLLALAVSSAVWIAISRVPGAGVIGGFLVAAVVAGVASAAAITGRTLRTLQLLAYLVAVEPAMRTYARGLPYLGVAYAVLAITLLLTLRLRAPMRLTLPFLAYALYVALELTGLLRSGSATEARAVLVPSAVLLALLAASGKIVLDGAGTLRVVGAYLVGIMSLAALTAPSYVAGTVTWATQSNFAATAGMGPNQISLLYSGAIFLLLGLSRRASPLMKLGMWLAAAALLVLMVLTFSRGGLYILAGGIAISLLMMPARGLRLVGVLGGYSLVALALFFVVVRMTEGRVVDRFADLDTSNRGRLAEVGWQMFKSAPLAGVGTGNYYAVAESPEYFGVRSGAHNELTRAAAEHGLPGLFLWLGFCASAALMAARVRDRRHRALRVPLLAMAVMTTLYNGLKLAAQPFLIFLAIVAYTESRRVATPVSPPVRTPSNLNWR